MAVEAQRESQRSPEVRDVLSVGDVVRSTINPELKGRIVWRESTRVRVELLTHPSAWWEKWGDRPVPLLMKNLELARASSRS